MLLSIFNKDFQSKTAVAEGSYQLLCNSSSYKLELINALSAFLYYASGLFARNFIYITSAYNTQPSATSSISLTAIGRSAMGLPVLVKNPLVSLKPIAVITVGNVMAEMLG